MNSKNDMINKIHNQLNNNIIKVVISVYYNDYVYNFDLAWIDQDSQEVDYSISKVTVDRAGDEYEFYQ